MATAHNQGYDAIGNRYALKIIPFVFVYGLVSLTAMPLLTYLENNEISQGLRLRNGNSLTRWYGLMHYTVFCIYLAYSICNVRSRIE